MLLVAHEIFLIELSSPKPQHEKRNSYVVVSTPGICEYLFIYLFVYFFISGQGNHIKNKPLGWSPSQYNCCSYEKEKCGQAENRESQGEDDVKAGRHGRWLEWCHYKPRDRKDGWKMPEASRSINGSLLRLSEGPDPDFVN